MIVKEITIKRHFPENTDLLKATGKQNLKQGCEALGISQSTFSNWKTRGLDKKKYESYFGKIGS